MYPRSPSCASHSKSCVSIKKINKQAHSAHHQQSLTTQRHSNSNLSNAINIISFNTRKQGQKLLGDSLRLMKGLKAHVLALQDVGHMYPTKEGKAECSNYHLEQFRFGSGKSDTLALIIDEGIQQHFI